MTSAIRYAIFFAPSPESALWRFGSSVLGYDAATGRDVEQFVPASVAAQTWHTLTEEPRRYGFHATLKAPFRLAEAIGEAELLAAVRAFARTVKPFDLILCVSQLDAFVALTARAPWPPVAVLERDIVTSFERFRAPLDDAERARRLRAPLTSRQRQFLDEYGYPYVLQEFRFHMTLSSRLAREQAAGILESLRGEFATRCPPETHIDRLAVFRENDGHFRVLENVCFG